MKKFIVLSIILLMLAGFVFTSSADVFTVRLWAGQTILVGEITVGVVGDNLVVTYAITDSCWELGETHLYVGNVEPTKSAPGQFPYGPEDADNGVYTIPLNGFTDTLYIAAHAVVTNTCCDPEEEETAWARRCFGYQADVRIPPGKNWASYFEFEVPD